jgi:hypothetical protein
MPLSLLAEDIYNVLRELVPVPAHKDPRITYGDLIAKLSPSHQLTDARDPRLAAALGDLVRLCKENGWPLISALVVRADTQRPGSGYYEVASPPGGDALELEIEWAAELMRVKQHVYPVDRR